MAQQQKTSKALNISLWVAQVLLAASLIWAASLKLFQSTDKLAQMWPWVAQVPNALVKFTGLVDLLGGLGLILPGLLRIQPKLTYIAALCIVALMIAAGIFHISRGEASQIGANVAFAVLALFIAWGRYRAEP
ncbi:MAG TPA: DoxX family protein [Bacteroidia bacterium]|jgi:hypothetical protein|nr:DoxX family protein [Bacteroidia bacterium]